MKTIQPPTAPVNAGDTTTTGEELLLIEFNLPAREWEAVKEESRRELITTDEVVALALKEYFETRSAMEQFKERTGIAAHDLELPILRAGVDAVMAFTKESGEITVPFKLCVVPEGMAPVFLPGPTVERLAAGERAVGYDDSMSGHHIANAIMVPVVDRDASELSYHLNAMKGLSEGQKAAVDAMVQSWEDGTAAPAIEESDDDIVSLPVRRKIRRVLEETAVAAEIEGGLAALVDEEFAATYIDSIGFFHSAVLDGWEFEPEERARCSKALQELRYKYQLEEAAALRAEGKEDEAREIEGDVAADRQLDAEREAKASMEGGAE